MAGSAPVATRWLLVEHPGPWGRDPVATTPLAGPVGDRLAAAAAQARGRILLLRRGERRPVARRAWYAVDVASRTWVTGTWAEPADLLEAADALGGPLDAGTEPARPLVLVCTHGSRDACCALRGRPIFAELAQEWPDEVWECTHLGGHRFSGTVLSLPDGACLGGLDAGAAVEAVRAHRGGRTPTAHLRGSTDLPPAAQAAQAWLLREHGPGPLNAVEVRSAVDLGDGVTRIELTWAGTPAERTLVTVVREELPPAPLSCGASPGEHAAYTVRPGEPASARCPPACRTTGAR
jgi:hypothetical protein